MFSARARAFASPRFFSLTRSLISMRETYKTTLKISILCIIHNHIFFAFFLAFILCSFRTLIFVFSVLLVLLYYSVKSIKGIIWVD